MGKYEGGTRSHIEEPTIESDMKNVIDEIKTSKSGVNSRVDIAKERPNKQVLILRSG